jgi:hypothetical protein
MGLEIRTHQVKEDRRPMKSIWLCAAVAFTCLAATGASGQSGYGQGGYGQGSMSSEHPKESKTVKLIGCLSRGPSADVFVLTNVEDETGEMGKASGGGSSMGGQMGTSGHEHGEHPMEVQLVGNRTLKNHLGHRVEISGTLEPRKGNHESVMSGTSGMSGSGEGHEDMAAHQVRVKTVKMLEESCK